MTAVSNWILHAHCLTDHKTGGGDPGQVGEKCIGHKSQCFFTVNMMVLVYFKHCGDG